MTGNGRALADEKDRAFERAVNASQLPEMGIVMFPTIVVDGRLFEARAGAASLDLEEVARTRVQFRGSDYPPFLISTIDVIRADELDTFAAERAKESEALLTVMSTALAEFRDRLADAQLEKLDVTPGSRGVVGVPPLVSSLVRAQRDSSPSQVEAEGAREPHGGPPTK